MQAENMYGLLNTDVIVQSSLIDWQEEIYFQITADFPDILIGKYEVKKSTIIFKCGETAERIISSIASSVYVFLKLE